MFARSLLHRALCALGAASLVTVSAPAQTSTSLAKIFANGSGAACTNGPNGPASSTSASCTSGTVAYPTPGSVSTASNNALRTANAQASIGPAQYLSYSATGISTQNSSVTFLGSPSGTPTNLVFHFNVASNATISASSAGDHASYGAWLLQLTGAQGGVTSAASAADTIFANAASASMHITNGSATASGYDFLLPFNPVSGVFTFAVTPTAESVVLNTTPGPLGTGSVFETLTGIDATNANGQVVASATFDPTTGLATINFAPTVGPPTTTPEPGSMALLGTGFAGLVPLARRRRR